MKPLPPIRTALKTRRRSEAGRVPIMLHSKLTEIGTLDLWCTEIGGERSWRLQFDVRSATQTDVAAHRGSAETAGFLDEILIRDMARGEIENTFGRASLGLGGKPAQKSCGRHGDESRGLAAVAATSNLGRTDRTGNRSPQVPHSRGTLAQPARLFASSRLRHGG